MTSVSRNEPNKNCRLFKSATEMAAVQKQTLPSFLPSLLFCLLSFKALARVELEINGQKNRVNALENVAEAKPKSTT